ncbi:MAG: hypothetical protein ACWGOD_04980 [Desulfobulbales bacterium]
MRKYNKEIEERETVSFDKAFWGFLIGTCVLLSMWFISGIYYIM